MSTQNMDHSSEKFNTPVVFSSKSRNATADLPFVHRPKRGAWSNWKVPATNDYNTAISVGRVYAAHFAQYLADSPRAAGGNFLGSIAEDIDYSDSTGAKGYFVGFFSQLELMIRSVAQQSDVFADANRVNAFDAAFLAKMRMEELMMAGA